jgi:hypothetical protein
VSFLRQSESGSFTKSGACSRDEYLLHVSDLPFL